MKIKTRIITCSLGLLALAATQLHGTTLGTAFTYQGRLEYNGAQTTGNYDLQLELYTANLGGTLAAGQVTNFGVSMIKGLFTTTLDFGNVFNGTEYWLQIGVRTNGSNSGFTALSPRQRLSPAPNALYAATAGTAGTVANSSVTATGLRTPAAPAAGQMLTYDGTSLVWRDPTTISGSWVMGGNNIAGGNFLGTVNNQDLVFKANNREALRLTGTQDLILQRPSDTPTFNLRNGLGVYGSSLTGGGWGEDGTRSFAHDDRLRGPVLFGESGGGLGVKSLGANGALEESLALKWDRSSVSLNQNAIAMGNLQVHGNVDGALTRLDVADNFTAYVRAASFLFGHSSRRGTPGRALVDDEDALHVNFNGDWYNTIIGGHTTFMNRCTVLGGADHYVDLDGNDFGVYGRSQDGYGTFGDSYSGSGVCGVSHSGYGVQGKSGARIGAGVFGFSSDGDGVRGEVYSGSPLASGACAIHGVTDNPGNYAGYFDGNVQINGGLFVTGSKFFKLDHPLDPANKYLVHSCVESPDVKNIYDGTVTTDASGEAVVAMPGYFEALNRDFRYQLTVIGQFAQAIVSSEIKGNQFVIQTDKPKVKVCWQVTGIRQDAYSKAHPMVVEQDKPAHEKGTYQHPELFGQPEEKGLVWAHNPELGQRLKEQRAKSAAMPKP